MAISYSTGVNGDLLKVEAARVAIVCAPDQFKDLHAAHERLRDQG